jgi:ribose transport system substrate-binding protein
MKSFRRSLACFLALLAPLTFAGPKIGVLLKGHSPFWDAMGKGASDAAAKLGAELVIKAPPTESDISVQIRLLQALSSQGIQALVIAPTNKDALDGPVAALAAKGIKVVVIDSPLSGTSAPFVGTDQEAAGEAAGQLLGKLVHDGDEIAFLRHNQGGGATEEREGGAWKTVKAAHPAAVIHGDIYASTEAGLEEKRAELLLEKYPNAKGIFASGTPGTMAMIHVLAAHNPGGIRFVGCGFNLNSDVVAALQNGTLSGWVAQLPQDVGAKGVEAAVELLGGQRVPARISTDFLIVTKDNLGDAKVQGLLAL